MSAQLSYEINQPVAYAGLLFDADAPRDVVSRDADGEVMFGYAVGRSSSNTEKQVVAGIGNGFMGISVRSLEREGAANTGDVSYADTETVAVMREGCIWAECPSGCNPGDSVKFTTITGALDSGIAVGGETQLNDATWETAAAAGELGVIRLYGPASTSV